MRIGVVPNLDRSVGGVYQYAVTLLEALGGLGTGDEFIVFTYGGETVPEGLQLPGPVVPLRRGSGPLGRVGAALSRVARPGAAHDPAWERFFASHGIELLVFTADADLARQTGVPYVVAVHDIQHRLHPEFPEVSADGEWDRREARLKPMVAGATVVLVDSEVGREDLLEAYGDTGLALDVVSPLPFLPAHYLLDADTSGAARARVREEYDLPERYLFYPAQFWPHKNHRRIVEALALLAAEGVRVPIVFAGTHTGEIRERTFAEVLEVAQGAGIADLVYAPGYVADEAMAALYASALALVMPTFFGPTNIPVFEAFQLGCPVITSDMRGIREQAGDAALLVDPESSADIAAAIRRIVDEPGLRGELARRGRMRLSAYTRDDYLALLKDALNEAKRRVAGGHS
ncbi:MAG: glycosyltransferase family 1 protein [Coriobacteriia bacterium]|nr:glycosyltransferase family 1 protein [Coriobacteriia bacterium]